MNTTNLAEISFPVYKLPSKPSEENGVLFYETYNIKSSTYSIRVVDDLKINKKTLGLRRLLLKKNGARLFSFKVACYGLGDMLKLTTDSNVHWLDSKGRLVKFSKQTKFNLVSRKIKNVIQKVGYVVLQVEDEVDRFRSIYGPPSGEYRAVIMVSGHLRLFYGYALPEANMRYKKV